MPEQTTMFETRTMLQALEQMYPARTFLKDTFFRNSKNFETKHVDLDYYKGKRRTAAYVAPVEEGQVMSRIGWISESYTPPYIKQKMETTAEELLKRLPGETIYLGESPLQRAERQLALDMATLDDAITRAEELQCSQALFTGQQILLDGNALIHPLLPTHKITNLTYLWTDTVHSKPIDDLRTIKRMIARDSGIVPNVIVMGYAAMTAFINHPQVSGNTAALSMVRVDRGAIQPQLLANGVTYYGYISELGCDIFTYDEWYIPADEADTSDPQSMVPDNKILMGSTNARMDMLYGPIKDMNALQPFARFPKSWTTEDPSVRWLMLQSSPLAVPWQVDSFAFAQVVE